jgi:hypothetical protein
VNKSSGFPRDPTTGVDIPNTGAQSHRPQPHVGPGSERWSKHDPAVVQYRGVRPQRSAHVRECRRNIVSGPGIFNPDMSQIRNVTLGGSRSLQFRLEAFNVFNQPVWGDPIMSMASPLYGTIIATRTSMRELQLGVKFSF